MRPKIEEHTFIVTDKPIHQEHLSQTLQFNIKQIRVPIIFLNEYNGILNFTNKNDKFIFISIFEGAEYNVLTIPPGAYEMESLDKEIKRIVIKEVSFKEEDYPLKIKSNFSTLGRNFAW